MTGQLGVPGGHRRRRAALLRGQPCCRQAMTLMLAMVLLCVSAVSAARVLQQADPGAFPGASPADQATQAQAWPPLHWP